MFSRRQFANLLKVKPRYQAANWSQAPYLAAEVLPGDAVSYAAGAQSGGYPAPTVTTDIRLGATSKGASYTTSAADAGKTLTVVQQAINAVGTAQSTSNAVTISPVTTFASLGYVCGNPDISHDYTPNRMFNNAVFDSRGFGSQGSNAKGGISLDANGWPAQAWQLFMSTALVAGIDGQLAAGTYACTMKSAGQACVITTPGSSSGVAVSNFINSGDGVTTTFTLTVANAGSTVNLYGSTAITYLDVPRDGVTPSANLSSPFNPQALAHYAKFSGLRFMGFLLTNGNTQVNWSDRPVDYPSGVNYKPYSWQILIQWINAVASYSGSKLKSVWLNIPGRAVTDYATQLSALLNSYPLTSAVSVFVELSNEPWNTSGGFLSYRDYMDAAKSEVQVIANYDNSPAVASVTRTSNVVTVTTTANLPAYVTNGAPMVAKDNSSATYSAGTIASPVTVTVTGAKTFTYPAVGTDGSASAQWAGYFNLASTLLTDNLSFSIFNLTHKYYIRQTKAMRDAWRVNRPQDRFVMNIQAGSYSNTMPNGAQFRPIHFDYAKFIGGGSCSWLYGAAMAPYVKSNSGNVDASAVFVSMTTYLAANIVPWTRVHIYSCVQYGIHPVAYEGGPDLESTPSLLTAALTDSRMGDQVTALLDTWFKYGGEHFFYLGVDPGPIVNGNAQGGWNALATFTDTASPRMAALTGYATNRDYANSSGAPGTLDLTTYINSSGGGQIQATSGMYYWFSQTSDRWFEWLSAVPRTRRYAITTWGTDSTNGTKVDIYVDGVLAGQSTLPANGAGSSGASVAGAVADPLVLTLAAGPHNIEVLLPANRGATPGVLQVSIAAA